MRTVGLIVATLALGGIVALWWRDGGLPSPVTPQASGTQAKTGGSGGGEDPAPSAPSSSDFQQAIPQQHEPVSESDAASAVGTAESSGSPPQAVGGGESNLAALELSASVEEVNPPPGVVDPIDSPQRFRERPTMAAYLSSQTSQDRVHFSLNQYKLDPDAVATLEALVAEMAGADQILKLVVDGHCDDTGTDQYNQALSEMRAAVVVEFLQGRGFVVREVVTRGFGERVPVASGRDEDSRARNRRADIRIDWVRKTSVEGSSVGLRSAD